MKSLLEYSMQKWNIRSQSANYEHLEKFKVILTSIVKQYDSKFAHGDSISLIFPLEFSSGVNSMNAYSNPFPATLDYSYANDTQYVTGIIDLVKNT